MRALVTGAAGFIGSTLTDRLLREGWAVRGVDCFTPYYNPRFKRDNLENALTHPTFELIEADLLDAELTKLVQDVDVVFHLAGQPGVRLSWLDGFDEYVRQNIRVTQRLLELCRVNGISRFVYASSSSVYGNCELVPSPESTITKPYSPYGVTKLAGELLCSAYAENFGVPTTSLRYFTVFGPRQRPDMAIYRMIEAGLLGRPFDLYGDGEQLRDFTFVSDVVDATLRAGTTEVTSGSVMNVAGGGSTTMNQLVEIVEQALGHTLDIRYRDAQAGDVRATGGSIEKASSLLGWSPVVAVDQGIDLQLAWHRQHAAVS